VKVGRLCSRCGFPQPRRLAGPLLGTAGLAVLAIVIVGSFARLEGGAPRFTPPAPSDGQWPSEADFEPDKSNEPSIFMKSASSETSEDDSKSSPSSAFGR
jgi:hypothetical protein